MTHTIHVLYQSVSGMAHSHFPSDPVVDDAHTVWVECQLRSLAKDELWVTMGIRLVRNDNEWKIDDLQWQDFRDEFYPGLSGREWLRAF